MTQDSSSREHRWDGAGDASDSEAREIDRMTLYDSQDGQPLWMTGVSGLLVSDLKTLNFLSGDQMERLKEVADRVNADEPFCSDVRLLDAWLDAFELMTSVREEDYR